MSKTFDVERLRAEYQARVNGPPQVEYVVEDVKREIEEVCKKGLEGFGVLVRVPQDDPDFGTQVIKALKAIDCEATLVKQHLLNCGAYYNTRCDRKGGGCTLWISPKPFWKE